MTSEFTPHPVPDGRRDIDGNAYMSDSRGALLPVETIKPEHLLEDETVRRIVGFALALSDQVTRFKAHVFEDLGDFEALLAQEYGSAKGGAKGNKTFRTVDGLYEVRVQVADRIDFGPQLQVAKTLIDECLNEWSSQSRPEIRAIVTRAFRTDKSGTIDRKEVFKLLHLNFSDVRWLEAMRALRDAIRVVGSTTYVRCYHRAHAGAPRQAITIDLAKA